MWIGTTAEAIAKARETRRIFNETITRIKKEQVAIENQIRVSHDNLMAARRRISSAELSPEN
jgi:septal ring factor EnvC (AmiA/AmiB activator)